MIQIAIILFREVLEIALIVGVVLATTRGISGRKRWALGGLAAGAALSGLVALFAQKISECAEGMGQEIFNAGILILAALLIIWTVIWMKHHGRQMTERFKSVGLAVQSGEKTLSALAVVVALAVLREGSEIVLFTYGVIASGGQAAELLLGGAIGFGAGALVGVLIYYGLIKISPKHIFSSTSILLSFLAAGMISQAIGFLNAAGLVSFWSEPLWDSSKLVAENGWLGQVLHSLLGYTERPMGVQVLFYGLTIGGMMLFLNLGKSVSSKKVLATALISLSLISGSTNAWSFSQVYSPLVEKGELELEYKASVDFDNNSKKDDKQKHNFGIGYGFTDWWFSEIYGELEKVPQGDTEFEHVKWENRFQLSEPGAWALDTGLYAEYEFAAEDEANDEIEMKILLEKQIDNFVHTANLNLEAEFGDEDEVVPGLSWASRYRWKEYLEPGVEVFLEFDEKGKDFIGPVISGKVFQSLKYNLGYLFGVSDDAPDGQLKWILEWEQRF